MNVEEFFMPTKIIPKRKKSPPLKPKKARITVECSLEERRTIRIMAAEHDQSMNDFLLTLVEKEKKACHFCETYGPSEKTIKVIEQLEKGKNIEKYSSSEEFWDSFYKDANDTENYHH